jgi:hypothetical protein
MPLRSIADGSIGERLVVEIQLTDEVEAHAERDTRRTKLRFFEIKCYRQ